MATVTGKTSGDKFSGNLVHKTRKLFLLSLADQGSVSGANFLTVALGAIFLPINEQGKLVYSYTAYIALVLLNVSAFFSVANIVFNETGYREHYRLLLLKSQALAAPLAAAMILAGLIIFGDALEWHITLVEAVLLSAFLAFQQAADFLRRSEYVFGQIGNAAWQSLWLYGARIGAILYFMPETVIGFLLAMLLPAIPVSLAGFRDLFKFRALAGEVGAAAELFRVHLKLSIWNIYNAPIRWAGLHLPIMLTGALHSVEAAAVLGTIRAVTTFANVLMEMLETFVPAWLATKLNDGRHALRRGSLTLAKLGAAAWIAGMIAIACFGEAAVAYMLGEEARRYSPILYIIWAGNGFYFAGRAVGLHYRMRKNFLFEFAGLATGAALMPLTLPLIPRYGEWGGAWSLMLVQVATLGGLVGFALLKGKRRSQRASPR